MALIDNFDANDVVPTFAFEAVPAGQYTAVITESEMKPTKAGTGQYLELVFEIVDGEHQGRRIWARLNLENPNLQAVEIARAELSAICRAVGVMRPSESTELHDLPLVITVKCKKRTDTGDITNEIRGYAQRATAAHRAEPGTTPPWKRS